MKTSLFSLLWLLSSFASLVAQIPTMPLSLDKSDSIDQIQCRIFYQLDFISDIEDRDYITQDFVCLEIGKKHSKEYSQKLHQADSLSKYSLEAGKLPRWVNDLVPPIVLYKSYPTPEKITVDYRLPAKAPVMTYEEERNNFNWQLSSERKQILNFDCQKAEVSWAGRQWIAWFTDQIPLPEGPYKFGGLPGLIIELYDSQKDYHYTCVGISYNSTEDKMLRWNWGQKATSKQELNKIIRGLYANPDQALKALGSPTRFAGDAMLDLPYNPIER